MIEYADLMGGLISCEFPYLVMIGFGCFFAYKGVFHKEAAISFSKLSIEIFIPIYYFINVCRSTGVEIFQKNFLIILSNLIYTLCAFLISFTYAFLSKMDSRYRFAWIFMNCFIDIKIVHRLIVNSFCFHLKTKTAMEKDFCDNLISYNYVQLFFQGILVWYVAFNLIREDRKNIKSIVLKKVENAEEKAEILENDNNKNTVEIEEKTEISRQVWWKEMIYIMFRPPLIAMFTGLVVGFITNIKNWVFNTKTAVYLFYDTFNNIGNSHIICGFLILGTNLFIKNEGNNNLRFRKIDLIFHFILKCLVLPFLGVIFSYIAHSYIPDNKALNFTCFIQWILPTTIELVFITQAKDVTSKDISICICIQWLVLVCLSNYINLPAFLSAVGMINNTANIK